MALGTLPLDQCNLGVSKLLQVVTRQCSVTEICNHQTATPMA